MKKDLITFSRFLCPETKLFTVKFRCISKVLCLQGLQKVSGCNSTIHASKNDMVCYEVQMHFGSFGFARFMKKYLLAFTRFFRPKTKLFIVGFR